MLNFLGKSISKIFGTKSDKDVKMLTPYVVATNAAFDLLHDLSNDDFRAMGMPAEAAEAPASS